MPEARVHEGHAAQSNSPMDGDRSVGAIILAAGASRRYGSPKQLIVVDGMTLLEHAIQAAAVAGLQPVAAVVPVWLSRPASYDDERLRWIHNAFPERGLSVSLRLGLDALEGEVDAAVVLLGDQPRVRSETLTALLAARGDRPIVGSLADGILAPPVLIESSHFHLVKELSGDIGLRQMLIEHPELVRALEVGAHPPDIDTPDDLDHAGGP
jgi:molybdenum cofactor cytidylyltransferase